jgi:two-component system phosphate regulon sensor histidine kinase PhoR
MSAAEIEDEAHRLGSHLPARVTFIDRTGRVMGDSAIDHRDLEAVGNHNERPEVVEARRAGIGTARRHSQTVGTDMLYVAAGTGHPTLSIVRLALPLTEIDQQMRAVRRGTFVALLLALLGALGLAWAGSAMLGRRVNAIAAAARRYAAGDLSQPTRDYEHDEIGTVSRVLDDTVRALGARAAELAGDRARMEAILSSMAEGVLAVGPQGEVQIANPAAREMLGIGMPAMDRHYLESIRHPAVAGVLADALEGRFPPAVELVPAGAPERRIVARAAPVEAPGGRGAVLVLHDITELRRADLMRRDFVANVSHELRTPLTAIRGYVEALNDEPVNAAERQRFLAIIERHASRMERLVRDLLRLAGLEARQETVEYSECSVEGLFRGAAADLSAAIEAKSQRVEIRTDAGAGPIITDAAKVQDAMRNLIENAVNYAPTGSTIVLGAACQDDRVVLTVSDDGPGIPEADLSRIFERFYRVDKARSRESGGTGLGLSIVKHLVELLDGRVWAANRPDGGAMFSISLPATRPVTRN